jgi:predicted transcriptional regulator
MHEIPDLPQAEFDVMDVLWKRGHATIKEIHAELSRGRKLAYTTVATLLNRLRERGYVESVERNFAYEFHPVIAREQVVRRKLNTLVDRVLGGDISPLAAYIAQNRKLTPRQIEALEEIIKSEADKEE